MGKGLVEKAKGESDVDQIGTVVVWSRSSTPVGWPSRQGASGKWKRTVRDVLYGITLVGIGVVEGRFNVVEVDASVARALVEGERNRYVGAHIKKTSRARHQIGIKRGGRTISHKAIARLRIKAAAFQQKEGKESDAQ